MTRDEFVAILARDREPVVLVEGTRDLPDAERPRLTAFVERLASAFPLARFRTGNAEGSDEAFAEASVAWIRSVLNTCAPRPHKTCATASRFLSCVLGDVRAWRRNGSPTKRGRRHPGMTGCSPSETNIPRSGQVELPAARHVESHRFGRSSDGEGHGRNLLRERGRPDDWRDRPHDPGLPDTGLPVATQADWMQWDSAENSSRR